MDVILELRELLKARIERSLRVTIIYDEVSGPSAPAAPHPDNFDTASKQRGHHMPPLPLGTVSILDATPDEIADGSNDIVLLIAGLWGDPDFWKLVYDDDDPGKLKSYIVRRGLPLDECPLSKEWYAAVRSTPARTALLSKLLFSKGVPPSQLDESVLLKAQQLISLYLSLPVAADLRRTIQNQGYTEHGLSRLAVAARQLLHDVDWCEKNLTSAPVTQVALRRRGARFSENRIRTIERYVERLLEDPMQTNVSIAVDDGAGLNRQAAMCVSQAKQLVLYRHRRWTAVYVENRNGTLRGIKPSKQTRRRFIRRPGTRDTGRSSKPPES